MKYKGYSVGEGRIDLLVGGELIVELKSVEQIAAVLDRPTKCRSRQDATELGSS